ncbi:MAG: hypothetical protein U5K28_11065 [Halobacteriales archaeon]|nr:hypothetical protein [Halobacteriales archaeon]
MTAPVEVDADVNDESGSGDESAGTKIPMTAPVEVGRRGIGGQDGVRISQRSTTASVRRSRRT